MQTKNDMNQIFMTTFTAVSLVASLNTVFGQVPHASLTSEGAASGDDRREAMNSGATLICSEEGSQERFQLSISPAPASVPALRYRFHYRDLERRDGNRAAYYRRAFDSIEQIRRDLQQTHSDDFDDWAQADAVPTDKLRQAVATLTESSTYDTLARAVVAETCDWGFGLRELTGPDLVFFHLPECDGMRAAGRLLALKARLEIEEGQFDDAVESIRMAYQISRDIADCNLFVNKLVGIATAAMSHRQVAHFISKPNAPNLYWALASLEEPFIDMRPAFRFEAEIGMRLFPNLSRSDEAHSPAEWSRLMGGSLADFSRLGAVFELQLPLADSPDWLNQLAATGVFVAAYPDAKRQLIASGMDPADVEAMPVGKAVVMQQARVYQYLADEMEKHSYVPSDQLGNLSDVFPSEEIGGQTAVGREYLPVASGLLPAMVATRAAQLRTQREIASLQVIEAIRAHIANSGGKLPDTLDDISVLPVPVNPITKKPFAYQLYGDTAVIDLPITDAPSLGLSRRYEITVRK